MYRRLLSLARGQLVPLMLTILCGLLAGWLTIGQARGLSLVVDGVFLRGKGLGDVETLLLVVLGIIIIRSLLAGLMEISASTIAIRVKNDLRGRLFAKIQALGPAFVRGERTGQLTTTAMEGVEALDAYFNQYLPQLVLTALVPLSILVFVFPLDLLSGVVLVVTAPIIPIFMILIGKGAEAVTKRQYETLSQLSAHFLDSLQGLTTLKIFGRSRAHTRSIAESSDKFRDVTLGVLRITFLSALALELVATISTAVVAVEVGLRLLYGQLSFDKALFLLILAPEFYIPLRMLGLRFHAGMAGTTAAKKIYEVLDLVGMDGERVEIGKQIRKRSGDGREIEEYGGNTISAISLHGVYYTYPGENQSTLKNINLEIKTGEHIALVGPSGAGKTTLVSLLLGFMPPSEGIINTSYESSAFLPSPPPRQKSAGSHRLQNYFMIRSQRICA